MNFLKNFCLILCTFHETRFGITFLPLCITMNIDLQKKGAYYDFLSLTKKISILQEQ